MARILIDCDGVLSDFVGHLLSELKARSVRVPETFVDYEIFTQLDDKASAIAKQMMNDAEFWSLMARHDEAVQAIDALKAADHDIYVVTSPWHQCMEWEFARRAWLARNFELRPTRMISTSEKHHVHGDVFVDDKPKHVMDWQRAWPQGRAFLMNRPWNSSAEASCPRINWDQEGVQALLSAARVSS